MESAVKVDDMHQLCKFFVVLAPIGGIYMLPNGSLLLSDLEKHALQLRSPDGKLTLLAQSKFLDSPDAMSLDREGRVYIAASQAGRSPGGTMG